jgi:hypothetical protein
MTLGRISISELDLSRLNPLSYYACLTDSKPLLMTKILVRSEHLAILHILDFLVSDSYLVRDAASDFNTNSSGRQKSHNLVMEQTSWIYFSDAPWKTYPSISTCFIKTPTSST